LIERAICGLPERGKPAKRCLLGMADDESNNVGGQAANNK
jgi:hypothetical protein